MTGLYLTAWCWSQSNRSVYFPFGNLRGKKTVWSKAIDGSLLACQTGGPGLGHLKVQLSIGVLFFFWLVASIAVAQFRFQRLHTS